MGTRIRESLTLRMPSCTGKDAYIIIQLHAHREEELRMQVDRISTPTIQSHRTIR
jgi:hypothetical protein